MAVFRITGQYVVEREFTCEAESEEAARNSPEMWDEVEEVTLERTRLDVTEEAMNDDEASERSGGDGVDL